MLFSRYKSLRSVNNKDLDPLLFYEHTLAQHVEMNQSLFYLLETAVIEHLHDDRCRNNYRYLRLWIMYILYLDNPQFMLPMLNAMIDNRIADKLATLYVVIAYYQLESNKLREAESTLLLGLEKKAQPIESLERTLHQFHKEHIIVFNTTYYTLKQFNIDYNHYLKYPTLKSQLAWIDVELGHSIRAGILRECCHNKIMSLEELRAKSNSLITTDGRFDDMTKDIDTVFNTIKRKGLSFKVITPKVNTKSHSLSGETSLLYEQTTIPPPPPPPIPPSSSEVIPTVTEGETANVVQLPHNDGFIQHQIKSREVDKHDDYHIYTTHAPKDNRLLLQLGETYHVLKKIGQGGMAHVYLVQNTNTLSFYGVKVQQPPHPWEFYILHQMHKRTLQQQQQQKNKLLVLPVYEFHHFIDKSYLIMPYFQHGTLLDAFNLYRNKKQPPLPTMPEPIVLLFILQLLQQVIVLHEIHIAHNDLKLDNIMMVKKSTSSERLPSLVMIDFGRSVDLSLFENAMYKANWPPPCAMSDYPFINEAYSPIFADYWQLATMAYLLLFGVPMQYAFRNTGGGFCIQNTIKRYWHKSVWIRFFETMLNPQGKDLSQLIQAMEVETHDVPRNLILDFISLLSIGSANL
ncbi:kinase-like domain-containing protein [Mucor mucedo]|uniref:kinase-like domain-containing protein n=1 Tax=Mucor mucedo TaxID=29922 RepID=UPI00222098BF|nr:kinase-like domain-containing protein [Mucor mucedo]KAI7870096.1 kinase-like domain-containing protein [Mucor mucedo]